MWHSHFKLGGPLETGLDKQNVQEELLLLSVNILRKATEELRCEYNPWLWTQSGVFSISLKLRFA